jgi:vacuolar-type H+-ATPase subunit F/Vma7
MTATVRVVCRPALAPGFALAGVTADQVENHAEAEPALAGLMLRDDVGVILLQEDIYNALSPEVQARLDRSAGPVVVPFPGPAWAEIPSAEERVVELLRRAIGYRVKLR